MPTVFFESNEKSFSLSVDISATCASIHRFVEKTTGSSWRLTWKFRGKTVPDSVATLADLGFSSAIAYIVASDPRVISWQFVERKFVEVERHGFGPVLPANIAGLSNDANSLPRFYEEHSPDLDCAVCCDLLNEPVVLGNCGHCYCAGCVSKLPTRLCPECRTPFATVVKNQFAIRLLSNVRRLCRYGHWISDGNCVKNGCTEWCSADALAGHEAKCGFRPVPCANAGCPWVVFHKDVNHHGAVCVHRPGKCSACDAACSYQKFQDHLAGVCAEACGHCGAVVPSSPGRKQAHAAVCPELPIHCSLGCNMKLPRRVLPVHRQHCAHRPVPCPQAGLGCRVMPKARDVESHLSECGFVSVECPYSSVGCRWTPPRRQLEAHIDAATAEHLRLAMLAVEVISMGAPTRAPTQREIGSDATPTQC
eukprot:TRINITY_DN5519_c2_g1_i2.p1 TRINITY_DN5519_c2_g1~~TRINITY_DN5519_c2_g1_i2.p1  ORF type:complete len:422 (-),score=-9.72 TRINITY_DN5519_c2_g1_i2:755-2020(-)